MIRLLSVVLLALLGSLFYFRVVRAEATAVEAAGESEGAPSTPAPGFPLSPVPAAAEVVVPALSARSLSAGLSDKGEWRGKPAMCDLNADGHLDLAVSLRRWDRSTPGDGIYVYLGDGRGNWKPSLEGLRRDMGYGGIEVADVNGDGTPDIAFSGHDKHPHLFLNALDLEGGGWTTRSQEGIEVAAICADVALGDIDGDGNVDLAAIGQFPRQGGLYVFRGNGQGDFEAWGTLMPPATYGSQVMIVDVDGRDGAEVVAATAVGPRVWRCDTEGFVLMSDGLPDLKVGGSDFAVLAAELDGHPGLELIVAGLAYEDHEALRGYRRDAAGAWQAWGAGLPATGNFYDLALAHLAPGAPPSLVVAGKTGITVVDMPAPGRFTVRGLIADTDGIFNVAAGDVDGDGRDEILYVGHRGVQVLKLDEPGAGR